MFKIISHDFRELFVTSSPLQRGLCEPMRTFHDSLETSSRIELQNSRELSHPSEIGLKLPIFLVGLLSHD